MDLNFGTLIDLEAKGVGEDSDDVLTVEGYASVFGNVDLGDDVVVKGAFSDTLKKRDPLLLFNHKMDDAPIGSVTEAQEDDRGLRFKAELPKDDVFVKGRIIPQLRRRGIKGVSIGFRTKKQSRRDGIRYIEKADLFEISLVNMPMNPLAQVTSAKSIGVKDWNDFTDREREAHLKSLGLSDELAKRIVRLDREGRVDKGQREAGEGMGLPDFASLITATAKRF